MANAQGKAGIASTRINMETQNAQDRNKAVQGFGNAGAGAIMYGDYAQRNPGPAQKADPSPNYDFNPDNPYGPQPSMTSENPEVLRRKKLEMAGG
jgi:hypothetical protein